MKYVISLGGSIIAPDKPDVNFLKKFRSLILDLVDGGHVFFLICGGGAPARDYQKAAKRIARVSSDDLDWLGIMATKANAELLRVVFGKSASDKVKSDPTEKSRLRKINIYSGWKPGWSTDYDAVQIAKTHGVKTVINLSNVSYVYDRNPKTSKNAKKIEHMSWKQFRKMFGARWNPGANVPFDPVAAKLAEKEGIDVIVMNGKRLANVKKFLANKEFQGTTIN